MQRPAQPNDNPSVETPKPDSLAAPTRRAWEAPRIVREGSYKHLVRGATGPHGDPGTPIGKRP